MLSNKQKQLIMSNIDRVLVLTDWEQNIPCCTVHTLTRIGSNHCPLILDDGVSSKRHGRIFRFEKQWTKREELKDLIRDKWHHKIQSLNPNVYSINKWHCAVASLRQFLKGWGGNIKGEMKKIK